MKSYQEVITKHRDEIIRMREEGKTLKEIAEYFDCPTIAHRGLPGFPVPKRETMLQKAQQALKEHEEEIRKLRKEGKTWQEISKILGIPGLDRIKHPGFTRNATLPPSLEKEKLFRGLLYINESKKIRAYISELKKKVYKEVPLPLELEGDWIITADWHIPFLDEEMLELMLNIAKENKIKNLLIAGDLFDFSHLKSSARLERFFEMQTLEDEFKIAKDLMSLLQNEFKQIVIIPGNHDLWLMKKLEGEITFPTFIKAVLDTCITSPYSFVIIHTEKGDWRVSHPASYRKSYLAAPKELSLKFPEQHMIITHYHRFTIGLSPDASHFYIELPAFCQIEKLLYTKLVDNFYPTQVAGFGYLLDSKFHYVIRNAKGEIFSY